MIENFTYVLVSLAGVCLQQSVFEDFGALFAADSLENVEFNPLPGLGSLLL